MMEKQENQAGVIGIKTSIGMVYDAWGKPKEALGYYRQAIAELEKVRAKPDVEEYRTSLAQQSVDVYQRAALMSIRLKQWREAFDISELSRARTFLDQLGNPRLDDGKGMEEDKDSAMRKQKLQGEIALCKQDIAEEKSKPASQFNEQLIVSWQSDLARKQKEYQNLLTSIKLSSPNISELVSEPPITLSEAQKRLPQDATLVSYFITMDKALAFVITRESFQVVEVPVSQKELEKKVELFRDFPNLKVVPQEDLKQFHKWLIAPIKSHIKTRTLGIVPHGVLHNLPFAAFTDGKEYLGDKHTLFHLPSVSVLQHIKLNTQPGGKLLALAYGEQEGLPFLSQAGKEATAIAKLYGAHPLIGKDATEAVFREKADEHDIVHLIGHYLLNSANTLFSRLALGPGNGHDGALELHEAYEMRLKKTNLVVLSVCQSQMGNRSRGDDIAGLNRAFLYARASTVIASLWNVDDEATSVLMTSFYTHLSRGKSKAEALAAAQADMRKKAEYAHPYYWAGFVLTGDPGVMTSNQNLAAEVATRQ